MPRENYQPCFIDSANSSMLLDSFGRVVDISWLLKIIMVLLSYESVKLRYGVRMSSNA